ncbi:4-amino-4-deoxy-L-arabinose-phosphoundecaprenol flippase subunit ArnF, partial [Bacillus sp. HC-Mk]
IFSAFMWRYFGKVAGLIALIIFVGFAASHLPPMTHLWDFIAALLAFGLDARILLLGLLGYLLSVFCWYKTLHKLALSKAYALLSMSYVLVWIASMVLPGWEGTFSLKALLGVACIMSGLMLISKCPGVISHCIHRYHHWRLWLIVE